MANAKSDYLENAVLNHFLGIAAVAAPTAVYVALFTTDPAEGGTGAEVTGGSYARKAAAFAAPSGGSTSNSANIEFTNMPAVTVSHVAVYSALTAGNLLWYGPANAAQTVAAGNTLSIPAGALTVSET